MELITKDHEVIKNLLLIIHRLKADIAEITTIYKPSMNGEIYLDHE